MKFTALILVSAVAFWMWQYTNNARLQASLAGLRLQAQQRDTLEREHTRLQALQDTLVARRATLPPATVPNAETNAAAKPGPASVALTVGEWTAPETWQNRGHATPVATLETLLWAASGGDVDAVTNLLILDEAVRIKAEAIRQRLPEAARASYRTPENLIAAVTTKAIPLGRAQLVWQNQNGATEATACLWLDQPEAKPVASTTVGAPDAKIPPMGEPNPKTSSVFLSLQQSPEGWRIAVPITALKRIEQELGLETRQP